MALGFGKRSSTSNEKDDDKVSSENEKGTGFGGDYNGFAVDSEAQTNPQGGRKMSRIDRPHTASIAGHLSGRKPSVEEAAGEVTIGEMRAAEASNAIQYRTCSWQKTAFLLFAEYICLAIMSFPWSYSILGLVPGLILTLVQAGFVLYTSLITWCVPHIFLLCPSALTPA